MSVFGVRKEFSDVNTPKTSISASAVYYKVYNLSCNQVGHNLIDHVQFLPEQIKFAAGGYKVRKEPSLTKRCEKMRKEPSFMRKQALLYRNKVFKEGIYKT